MTREPITPEQLAEMRTRFGVAEFDHMAYAGKNVTIAQLKADGVALLDEVERLRREIPMQADVWCDAHGGAGYSRIRAELRRIVLGEAPPDADYESQLDEARAERDRLRTLAKRAWYLVADENEIDLADEATLARDLHIALWGKP